MSPSNSSFSEIPAPIVAAEYLKKFATYGKTVPHVFQPVEQQCGDDDCDLLSDRFLMITNQSISVGCRDGSVMYYARLSEIDSVIVCRDSMLMRCCPRIGTTTDLLVTSPNASLIVANAAHYKMQTFRLPLAVVQVNDDVKLHKVGWLSDGIDMVDALLWEIPRREESHLHVRPTSPAEAKELILLHQLRHDLSKAEKGLRGEPRPLDMDKRKPTVRCAMHESLVPAFGKMDAMFIRIVQQLTKSGKQIDSVIAVCSEAVLLCDLEGNVKRMLRYQQLQDISSKFSNEPPVIRLTPHPEEGEQVMTLSLIDDERNCHPRAGSLLNALERAVLDSGIHVPIIDEDSHPEEQRMIKREVAKEELRRDSIRLELPPRRSPITAAPQTNTTLELFAPDADVCDSPAESPLSPRRQDILDWLVKSALPYSESQLRAFSEAVIDCDTPEVAEVTRYLMETVKTMSKKEKESNLQQMQQVLVLQGKVANLESMKRRSTTRELKLQAKCNNLESSLLEESLKTEASSAALSEKCQELEKTVSMLRDTVSRLEGELQ
eukprot:TRINITY_DN844_c0_g1_i1.p1 TRINITY_DN844_c0_g1~~TRINITY_DN844_c0_g1_i1.p1  ORF type:complete len:548 (+),score=128.37 TRINITY_DN844_c0_g1_i1:60-1703(+)